MSVHLCKGNKGATLRANEKRQLPDMPEYFHWVIRADGALFGVGEIISVQHTDEHHLHINDTLVDVIFVLIRGFSHH